MKSLLLLLALATAGSANAQRPLDTLYSKLRDRVERRYQHMPNAFAPRRTPFVMKAPLPLVDSSGTTLPYLALKAPAGTYTLPQDGMPCVVPDTEGIAEIPNAAPVRQLPFGARIPNPYAPDPKDRVRK